MPPMLLRRGLWTTRTRASRGASSSATAPVRSVEASSNTGTSRNVATGDAWSRIASTAGRRFCSSFSAGTMTVKLGMASGSGFLALQGRREGTGRPRDRRDANRRQGLVVDEVGLEPALAEPAPAEHVLDQREGPAEQRPVQSEPEGVRGEVGG